MLHHPPSISKFVAATLTCAFWYALTYDASMQEPSLTAQITRLNYEEAAPAITGEYNAMVYFQFAGALAIINELAGHFGELTKNEYHTRKLKGTLPTGPEAPLTTTRHSDEEMAEKKEENPEPVDVEILQRQREALIAKMVRIPKNVSVFSLIMTLMAVTTLYLSKPLLTSLNQSEKTTTAAKVFFDSFAMFFSTFHFRLMSELILLSAGKRILVTAIALTSFTITLALQLSFVKSLDTLAWSTGINFIWTALIFSVCVGLFKSYDGVYDNKIHLANIAFPGKEIFKNFFSWQQSDLKEIGGYCIKAALNLVTIATDIFIPFFTNITAAYLPGNAIKVWNNASQFLQISAWLTAALSQAAGFIVGTERGQAEQESFSSVSRAVKAGLLATLIPIATLGTFVTLFPSTFASEIVRSDTDDLPSWELMGLTALFTLFDSQRTTALQMSRNLVQQTWCSTGISLAGSIVSIGAAIGLSRIIGLNGIPIGLTIGAALSTLLLYQKLPQNIELAKNQKFAPEQVKKSGIASSCCTFFRRPERATTPTPDSPSASQIPPPPRLRYCPC